MSRQPKTVCEICGKKFENGNQLRAHKSSHSKKEFICDICGEKIIGASQYKIHKANHTNKEKNNKKCNCEICGKEFKSLTALYGHMASHNNKNRNHKYKCIHCNKEFSRKDYIDHIINLINDSDNYLIKFKGHVVQENKKYVKCKICGIDKFDLTKHIEKSHNITIKEYIDKYDDNIKINNDNINDIKFEINERPIIKEDIKNQNLLLARGIMNHKEKFINSITPNNVVFTDTKYYLSKVINGKKVVKNPDFVIVDENYIDNILDDIDSNGKISLKNYKHIIGIIEHYGCYWHGPKVTGMSIEQHEQETKDYYKLFNKECLIIWEDEVNENNKEKLIIKINNFINSLKS